VVASGVRRVIHNVSDVEAKVCDIYGYKNISMELQLNGPRVIAETYQYPGDPREVEHRTQAWIGYQ
jgi:hypothetical protein